MYQIAYPAQAVSLDLETGNCKLAISSECKQSLVNKQIVIPGEFGFECNAIAEVRIVPANGQLWAEYVYKVETKKAIGLDYSKGIGIDPGYLIQEINNKQQQQRSIFFTQCKYSLLQKG